MVYEIKPYPEWSYSQTRDQLFHECLRKYYYHYYASHNGWLIESASSEQIIAYRLKQLTSLFLHFGASIHTICQSVVTEWQSNGVIPSYESLSNRLRSMLNQAYLQSRDRQAWMLQPKKRHMLAEINYDGELDSNQIEIIKERQRLCLYNILKSSTLGELTNSEGIEIVELEQLNTMIVDETRVYVKIDLLYKRENETWVIVDWITGKEDKSIKDQMHLYALYVKVTYNVSLEKLELRTEYLLTGESISIDVNKQNIELVERKIKSSVDEMKELLDDDYWYRPKHISHFTPQPSPGKCNKCNFREICDEKYENK